MVLYINNKIKNYYNTEWYDGLNLCVKSNVHGIILSPSLFNCKHCLLSSIGLTTVAISLGYLIIREVSELFGTKYLYLGVASLGLITLLFLYFYKDERDIEYRSPRILQDASLTIKIKASLLEIYRDFLSKPFFFNSLLSYFFFEMAFYCLFIPNIELGIESLKNIPYLMILAYFLGVILLWVSSLTMKIKNGKKIIFIL